jgi:multisubunit Na+/H+ antiporter MnhC subunit
MTEKKSVTTYVLWAVFLSLLAVLLPHTAWAFRKFEPSGEDAFTLFEIGTLTITNSDLVSYVAAFAFEAAIAVLVHKLSEHITNTPRSIKSKKDNWTPLRIAFYHYVNPISFALMIVTIVSALANLAHAVEYGQTLRIMEQWGISLKVYTFAFGAILPVLSLTFARVLSDVTEDEAEESPELTKAKQSEIDLRRQLRESELRLKAAEERARTAEEKFGAMGDLAKHLFAEDKRQRIVFVRQTWPELKNSAIAVITQTSESHVSETLKQI